MDDLLEKITSIIAGHYGRDPSEITPETILEELERDYIDAAEVHLELEDDLKIAIDEDIYANCVNVQDVYDAIKELKEAA